jgi:hypothetical protein
MVHARAVGSAVLIILALSSGIACDTSTLDGSGTAGSGGGGSGGSGSGGSAGKTYSLRFVCDPGHAECPAGQPCPEVPLSSPSCGDLPGVFDHDPIPATVGRPIGCVAMMPYGNPYYADAQLQCTCFADAPATGTVGWACAL